MQQVLCSECFENEGIRVEADGLGTPSRESCQNCGSTRGKKLDLEKLRRLAYRFFVQGTIPHGTGGYVPILQYDERSDDEDDDDIGMLEETIADWNLIKRHIGGRLFNNAPDLWRLGITDHYDDDLNVTEGTISGIVKQLSIREVPAGSKTYRIRIRRDEDASMLQSSEYDAPPATVKRAYGRFDDDKTPILYTSPNVEVCLHETRIVLTDEIYVATLVATQDLRLADLSGGYDQTPATPFEDLRYFFQRLILTREESAFAVARRVARSLLEELNVDGFITASFYRLVLDGPGLNYCFFGNALNDGKLTIASINRIHLRRLRYNYVFGPAF